MFLQFVDPFLYRLAVVVEVGRRLEDGILEFIGEHEFGRRRRAGFERGEDVGDGANFLRSEGLGDGLSPVTGSTNIGRIVVVDWGGTHRRIK